MPTVKSPLPLSRWLLKATFCALLFWASAQTAMAHGMSEAEKNAILNGGLPTYFQLGAAHMLTGYDHLLFLLGVIFFLDNFRDIVKTITAFTLGHSLTLTLGTLFHITANAFAIDAVIAISVIYKAFDNLNLFEDYLKIKRPNLTFVIFVFGLIHGFGLATRLQELPLGETGLLARILSFNVGVEFGQVVALMAMVWPLKFWRRSDSFPHFSKICNHAILVLGVLLFLIQGHGYLHSAYPEEFGFPHEHPEHQSEPQPQHDNL
jgi:hydrogenase/urease accessory protein HupE